MCALEVSGPQHLLDLFRREYPLGVRNGRTIVDRPLRSGEAMEARTIASALGLSSTVHAL